jgi:hypothetical protein
LAAKRVPAETLGTQCFTDDLLVGAVGIELKVTLKARKFRSPDIVCRKPVRFLLQNDGAQPNKTFEGCAREQRVSFIGSEQEFVEAQ